MLKFKNYILFIVFFCFALNAFSQLKKKYYYDENKVEISLEEYNKKIDSKKYTFNLIQIDTAFVVLLFRTKIIDKLEKQMHQKLNRYLFDLHDGKIDTTKTMVIYFLPFEGNNEWKKKNKSRASIYSDGFLDDVNNDSSVEMLWIYQPEIENMEYHHIDKIPWKADSGRLFQILFFPLVKQSGFVVLKPNGNYHFNIGFDGPGKSYSKLMKKLSF